MPFAAGDMNSRRRIELELDVSSFQFPVASGFSRKAVAAARLSVSCCHRVDPGLLDAGSWRQMLPSRRAHALPDRTCQARRPHADLRDPRSIRAWSGTRP